MHILYLLHCRINIYICIWVNTTVHYADTQESYYMSHATHFRVLSSTNPMGESYIRKTIYNKNNVMMLLTLKTVYVSVCKYIALYTSLYKYMYNILGSLSCNAKELFCFTFCNTIDVLIWKYGSRFWSLLLKEWNQISHFVTLVQKCITLFCFNGTYTVFAQSLGLRVLGNFNIFFIHLMKKKPAKALLFAKSETNNAITYAFLKCLNCSLNVNI